VEHGELEARAGRFVRQGANHAHVSLAAHALFERANICSSPVRGGSAALALQAL
jgi:hypothetical protein